MSINRVNPTTALREVAEAVLAEILANLNVLEHPVGFTVAPSRMYNTELALEESDKGDLNVVMGDVTVEMLDRIHKQYDCRVDVVVRQYVDPNSLEDIDALSDFAGRVSDLLSPSEYHTGDEYYHVLTTLPAAFWVKTDIQAPYVPEHLRELSQFTSIISVTYRLFV